MDKGSENCSFRIGDEVKLVSDAATVYKIKKVHPSKLKLTKECKYDLLSTIDSKTLPNVSESQIRKKHNLFPVNSLKLVVIFQLVFLSLQAQTTGQGSDDGQYRATVSYGVYEGKYDTWIKIYDSTNPSRDPIVMFYDLLGIEKYAYLKFVNADQFLIVAGANRIILYDISNQVKVHEVGGFKGITSIAYLSKSRKLDVFEQGGITTVDFSNYIPEAVSTNVMAAKNEKALIDYFMNVAFYDKEAFLNGFNHMLLNESYIYPFKDDELFVTSFNTATRTASTDYTYIPGKMIIEESLGKVEYLRHVIGQSIYNIDDLVVSSYIESSFDKSSYLHFEKYSLSQSNGKIYFLPRKSIKHSLKSFEPITGSISKSSPYCVRLLNGNFLMVMRYNYETLSNQLYKDIGSGGLGNISRGKEIKTIYKLVVFDKDGETVLKKANYILPDMYEIRLGPGGTFVLVSDNIFRPEKMQNASIETLKEYADVKNGIAITLFDENLNVSKFEQVEIKKDPRIKNPRLIGSLSDRNMLYIFYASNQEGLVNKETFTISEYSFVDGKSKRFISSTILDQNDYFGFDVGFVKNGEIFLMDHGSWDNLRFYRIKHGSELEISEFKVPFINVKKL